MIPGPWSIRLSPAPLAVSTAGREASSEAPASVGDLRCAHSFIWTASTSTAVRSGGRRGNGSTCLRCSPGCFSPTTASSRSSTSRRVCPPRTLIRRNRSVRRCICTCCVTTGQKSRHVLGPRGRTRPLRDTQARRTPRLWLVGKLVRSLLFVACAPVAERPHRYPKEPGDPVVRHQLHDHRDRLQATSRARRFASGRQILYL